MEWTDRAVLLGVAKSGRDDLIVTVLTERHGRQSCLLEHATKTAPTLLPGCSMVLEHAPGDMGEPGRATLADIAGGLGVPADAGADAGDDDPSIRVALKILVHVRDLLELVLQPDEPEPKVFAATRTLIQALTVEPGRWPIYFARWEMGLLAALGFAGSVERCRPAFRHGEAIYYAPRGGRAVTRSEAGAFLDRMIPVPGFLLGAPNATLAEIRQAFRLTELMFATVAGPALGVAGVPASRDAVLAELAEVKTLPRIGPKPRPRRRAEADEELRRQQSMQPLMVARRVAPAIGR